MSWWSRLINVVRPDRLQHELDEEQRFHLQSRADDLEGDGLSADDARAQATRQCGNRLALRQASRDVKLLPWIESLSRDLRVGARMLRRDAAVSAAAVISLGLAIGACTAAFSLIDALILRKLPVPDPSRLVYVGRANSNTDDLRFSALFSYPLLETMRQTLPPHVEVFSMSHQSLRQAILPDAGGAEEKLQTQFVSGNAFDALGVSAAIGRVLRPADDVKPGGHPVAVVSHAFWTRRLGADPTVLGSWIQIEQRPYQIIGVAQAGFTGAQPGILTDVWLPNMMFNAQTFEAPHWNWLQVWGRFAPGETAQSVQPIVQTAFANFEAEHSVNTNAARAESRIEVNDATSGYSQVRQDFARPLLTLAAIVGLVLLIACSNVANLLLARGAARTREMVLRASIGAARQRLLQQVLIESGLLTAAAIALAVVASRAAVPFILAMLTTNERPVYLDAGVNWRVLVFVGTLGCLTTILFGLAPAIRASSASPGDIVAAGDRRHTAATGASRLLVATQIGFSLMILFVSALLMRSFDRLESVDLGFDPKNVVLMSVETRERLNPERAREVARQLLDHVRAFPGVDSASLSGWALFRGFSNGNEVGLPDGGRAQTFRLEVASQFFRTMRTPLVDGREFLPSDREDSNPMPVIINDVFARKYLPGGSPLGRRLTSSRRGQAVSYEIVGVVGGTRDGSVRGAMNPFLFTPSGDPSSTILIRSTINPRSIADRVRQELPKIHPSLRLVDVTVQEALVANTLLRERLLATLSAFFAGLGLVLAAVGLYGVLSYAVVRRTREIGIRVALGAQPMAVATAVVGRIAVAVIFGVFVGLAGGLYFARFVRTFLYETEPVSVWSVGLPLLGLLIVAYVATWAPVRRAMRVDAAEALRVD